MAGNQNITISNSLVGVQKKEKKGKNREKLLLEMVQVTLLFFFFILMKSEKLGIINTNFVQDMCERRWLVMDHLRT